MKRRVLTIGILAAAVMCAPGCGNRADSPANAAVSEQKIVLRLAETHPIDYPTTKGDLEFARLVGERSNGRIRIEVYPNAQLGQEKEAIEQVQFGGIDFTRVSISPLAAFAKQFDALQLPYVFRSSEHEWKVLNGPIGDEMLASLEPAGFIGLSWFESGARNFYNTGRAIKSPEDLKGLKIRVQQSDLMVGMVNSLGAIAVPMAYGEVYTGLKTGLIEGAENNWPSYMSTGHYEVAKYYTLDEHTRVPEITIGSKISLGKLSAADRALIMKAAKDSMPYQIAQWAAYKKIAEDKVREGGAIVTLVPDKSAFRAAMNPVYEKQSPEIRDLAKRIQDVK